MKGGCNNISMAISNNRIWADTFAHPYGVIPFNAQIYNYGNPVIKDTMNWVKVSSIYVAQGGEKYITIGNFKYDNATLYDTIPGNSANYGGAAYYVDDVQIIPLSQEPAYANAYAGDDITITAGDSVFVGSLINGVSNIAWYNNTGQKIDSTRPGFWVHPSNSTYYVVEQTVCGNYSNDTIFITVQPLPLKFISFSATLPKEGNVENRWQTANEINVSHFYVQRSTNGRDFVIIHKEQANNQALNNYSFIDETPNEGVNYYRIVSVDRDGKTSFSEVRQLVIRNQQLAINIFPNPAKDFISVVGKSIKEIQIINQLGQVVYKEIATGTNLRNDATIINIKNFNKGLYVVQVILKNGAIEIAKFVKEQI